MERTILFHLVTEQSSFGDTLLRYCGQGQVYPYLLNPIYSRTAAGGHFGREDFPWENIEHMSDLAAYIV